MADDAYLRSAILVAGPHLFDPNFRRSVVLVATHDADGAFGLVLNRPTDIELDDVLGEWTALIGDPVVAFEGGPVQREIAVGLGRLRAGASPPGPDVWTPIAERVGLLDLAASPLEFGPSIEALRVFSGYSGWGPGQLDAEVAAADWFVLPFHPDDPFRADADALWRAILRRQSGRLAMFADYPNDPRQN